MINKEIKKIDLSEENISKNLSIDDVVSHNEDGKERIVLITKKEKNSVYGAYRTKDGLGGNMINLNMYMILDNGALENLYPIINFQEQSLDPEERKEYYEHDKKLKKARQ